MIQQRDAVAYPLIKDDLVVADDLELANGSGPQDPTGSADLSRS